MTFEQQLEFGKIGEGVISRWLQRRGYSVLPVYEKEIHEGKGPQVLTIQGNFIAPDLLVFDNEKIDKIWWIEAKHKTAFTWHRITEQWVTGIDLRHYEDYLHIANISPWPVWLLFLQRDGQAKDTPPGKTGPTGLYGGALVRLTECENHRHANWGPSEMVYWAETTLTKIAELKEVLGGSTCPPL